MIELRQITHICGHETLQGSTFGNPAHIAVKEAEEAGYLVTENSSIPCPACVPKFLPKVTGDRNGTPGSTISINLPILPDDGNKYISGLIKSGVSAYDVQYAYDWGEGMTVIVLAESGKTEPAGLICYKNS